MKTLTAQELISVLKAARGRSTRRRRCMVPLAYRHGLRASEACGLTLANIDVRTQSIDVQRLKGSRHRTGSTIAPWSRPCSMKSPR